MADFTRPDEDGPDFDFNAAYKAADPTAKPNSAGGDAELDLSHDGLALDMGRLWAGEGSHVALWGKWLFWTSTRWVPDERLDYMTRTRDFRFRQPVGS
jgi:putative DNA primase/helicase